MGKPSKQVLSFMEHYNVASDEIWEVHGSTWVVKHKALERVAAENGIVFEPPQLKVCDLEKGMVVVLVSGKMGERVMHSFGEATPKNCKNAYVVAMAEKRAVDRVILKLLAAHGDLYSESEADEFSQPRPNPHVNKASDFYDHVSADIPDVPATKMKVKDARPQFDALVKEMRRIQDPAELKEWGAAQAEIINSFPGEWPTMFRGEYTRHKQAISNTIMAG
jgi:hypothetical protein